jgi:hypothetical protein
VTGIEAAAAVVGVAKPIPARSVAKQTTSRFRILMKLLLTPTAI